MSTPLVAILTGAGVLASYAVAAVKSVVTGVAMGGNDFADHVGALLAQSVPPWWAPIALAASVPLVTACSRLFDQRARIRELMRAQRTEHEEKDQLAAAFHAAEIEISRLKTLVAENRPVSPPGKPSDRASK